MYTKPFDQHFFDRIDTEEKAYWLGFIYADGYVTKSVFGIKLQESDTDHLKKLKAALKSEHAIGHYINKSGFGTTYGPFKLCAFSIDNKYLVDTLIKNGVVYNKSKILTFPSKDIVPDHLLHHFIRGYFDGDGSVYHTPPHGYLSISMDGTEHFLSEVLKIFHEVSGTNAKLYDSKGTIKSLKVGGSKQVQAIYEYMYKDATVFLGRKKERFEEYFGK